LDAAQPAAGADFALQTALLKVSFIAYFEKGAGLQDVRYIDILMSQASPTLEGFRAVFRRPSLGFAEISWRWAFGSTCVVLSVFSIFEYLDTLPVSRGDLLLLRSRQPALISRAIQHTLTGSAMRAVLAFVGLSLAMSAGWIVLASLGRLATVLGALGYFRERRSDLTSVPDSPRVSTRPLLAINFFRVAATLAAGAGCLGALVIGSFASSARHPAPEAVALITMTIAVGVWMAWSGINWYLSLAAIFVVARAQDTLSGLASALDFCCVRAGAVLAVGTWFGLAHLGLFMVTSIAVMLPLGTMTVLPGRLIVVCIFVLTLVYFACADFLYMGRMAAYIAMLELPPVADKTLTHPVSSIHQPTISVSDSIDRDEVILSDIPPTPEQ